MTDDTKLTVIDGGKPAEDLSVKIEHRGGDTTGGKLTTKQEGFINSILKDRLNQSDAYRANYSTGRMSAKSTHDAASKLFAHPVISQRIKAGREAQAEIAVHSGASLRSSLIKMLEDMTKTADTDANKLRAAEILGKTEYVSLFLDRSTDIPAENLTAEEVEEQLTAKLKEAFGQ